MSEISKEIMLLSEEASRLREACGEGRMRWPKEFRQKVLALWSGGVSRKEIVEATGISPFSLYDWLLERKVKHLPENAFTKAIDYLLKRRKEFTAFLTNVSVPLPNNDAERSIRQRSSDRRSCAIIINSPTPRPFSLPETCANPPPEQKHAL